MKTSSAFCMALFCAALPLENASATDIAPKPDNGISAHELETGKLIWANDTLQVGNTHLSARKDSLEVVDRRGSKETRFDLSLADGTTLSTTPTGSVLARSVSTWPPQPVVLSNGWTLSNFSPGNDKVLTFTEASGTTAWTVDLGDYTHAVAAAGEYVVVAKDYLTQDAVLRAWKAGESKVAWTFDLNSSQNLPDRGLRRITLWPQSETLLVVQSHTHLFGLNPKNGTLLWHIDAVAATGATNAGDFYQDWGIEHAAIAFHDDVMVVAWDRRVGVWKYTHQTLLWTLLPDTEPHAPSPMIHNGFLYLSTGAGRTVIP